MCRHRPSAALVISILALIVALRGDAASIVLQKDGQIKLTSSSDVTVKASGNINLQATRVNQP